MDAKKDKEKARAAEKPDAAGPRATEKRQEALITPQKEVSVIEKEKTEKAKVNLEGPGRMPFAMAAGQLKLTPARQVVLKRLCKWDDSTKVSAAELDAAIRKHLKGEV